MLRPVSVNIEVQDVKGNVNIAAAILDFHPTQVKRIVRTYDGMASIVTADLMVIKVLIPYEALVKIYNEQHKIDRTFQEDVDEYYKDNYKSVKDDNNGKTN